MYEYIQKHYFACVSGIATVIAVILLLLGWMFMKHYEEGVLEVCADQQDAYVQLVLDQINIRENRTDENIIEDILSSMDSSTNKYWTFSKDEAMLFVKDVTETNKYKGFTTATYYMSESSEAFLNNLRINHVTHANIDIRDKSYIASGVIFNYNDALYRLCLLTNRDVFLDNNAFLSVRINLGICYAVATLLIVVGAMYFARDTEQLRRVIKEKNSIITELNDSIAKLNDRLLTRNTYDMRRTVFQESMLDEFLGRIQKKDIKPVSFAIFNCASEEEFLSKAQVMLDRSVLRFRLNGDRAYTNAAVAGQIMLVFLNCGEKQAYEYMRPIISTRVTLRALEEWNPERGDIKMFAVWVREMIK